MENECYPDPKKQTEEIIFCCKIKKLTHSSMVFNNYYSLKNIVSELATIMDEIFETNSSFHVKSGPTGKD